MKINVVDENEILQAHVDYLGEKFDLKLIKQFVNEKSLIISIDVMNSCSVNLIKRVMSSIVSEDGDASVVYLNDKFSEDFNGKTPMASAEYCDESLELFNARRYEFTSDDDFVFGEDEKDYTGPDVGFVISADAYSSMVSFF